MDDNNAQYAAPPNQYGLQARNGQHPVQDIQQVNLPHRLGVVPPQPPPGNGVEPQWAPLHGYPQHPPAGQMIPPHFQLDMLPNPVFPNFNPFLHHQLPIHAYPIWNGMHQMQQVQNHHQPYLFPGGYLQDPALPFMVPEHFHMLPNFQEFLPAPPNHFGIHHWYPFLNGQHPMQQIAHRHHPYQRPDGHPQNYAMNMAPPYGYLQHPPIGRMGPGHFQFNHNMNNNVAVHDNLPDLAPAIDPPNHVPNGGHPVPHLNQNELQMNPVHAPAHLLEWMTEAVNQIYRHMRDYLDPDHLLNLHGHLEPDPMLFRLHMEDFKYVLPDFPIPQVDPPANLLVVVNDIEVAHDFAIDEDEEEDQVEDENEDWE